MREKSGGEGIEAVDPQDVRRGQRDDRARGREPLLLQVEAAARVAQHRVAAPRDGAAVDLVEPVHPALQFDHEGAVALAGGHIEVHVAVPVSYKPLVEAKKVKILAVASDARSPLYGNLPTFRENGVDLVIGAFHGVYVPKATPPAIVRKWHGRSVQQPLLK